MSPQLPESEASQRLAWVKEMRIKFSPKAMLAEDGSINQEFFKPKTVSQRRNKCMAQDCRSRSSLSSHAGSATQTNLELVRRWLCWKKKKSGAMLSAICCTRHAYSRALLSCKNKVPAHTSAVMASASAVQGIEKYGIGRWNEISAELLPNYDDQSLRIKATKLMGSQSLARYVGWKGNKCAYCPFLALQPAPSPLPASARPLPEARLLNELPALDLHVLT